MRTSIISIILVACWLSGCQINPAQTTYKPINDIPFEGYQNVPIETIEDIFHLTPEAQQFVDDAIIGHTSSKDKIRALVDAIFSRTKLDLRYSASANTTAMQTFERGFANCLSLSIMTYAMVDYLGYDAVFQDVQIPEFWTIRNGQTLLNAHINLRVRLNRSQSIIIDFDPYPELSGIEVKRIAPKKLIASFYSNIAAEYLIIGDDVKAFAYLNAAIQLFPDNEGLWLNLGAAYSRNNMTQAAISAYKTALELAPDFNSAYDNLSVLYRKIGEHDKAEEIQSRLHIRRMRNPFYHMMLAEHALKDTKPEEAIMHYRKALRLDRQPHEFHFGLAKAYTLIGDHKNAEKALKTAIKHAKSKDISAKYNRKLSMLARS